MAADTQTMMFKVPSDCTPRFDPSTPWKEQAIAKILQKVERDSRQMAWTGDPATVDVVIGNFNFDYPQVEVFIPRFNKLLYVTLRDDLHPPKDLSALNSLAIKQEDYEGRIQDESKKILKYGINRTIHWGS